MQLLLNYAKKYGLILLLVGILSCNGSEFSDTPIKYTEQIAKVVNYVTAGPIRASETIEVKFVDAVKNIVSPENLENVFEFSPSIAGKAYWKDDQTLVFEPEEKLTFFKKYRASVKLNEISTKFEKDSIPNLDFNLRVVGREITHFEGKLALKNPKNPKDPKDPKNPPREPPRKEEKKKKITCKDVYV